MLYDFSLEEKQFLKGLGHTPEGMKLRDILMNIHRKIDSTDGIQGDYGAQVEGRNLAKKFLKEMLDAMSAKEQLRKFTPNFDDMT